jgi:hypothetical protein
MVFSSASPKVERMPKLKLALTAMMETLLEVG